MVSGPNHRNLYRLLFNNDTTCRLRDQMGIIKEAAEINDLAEKVPDAGGVYFVTAFTGLLAPYWDTSAGGLLIGGVRSFTPLSNVLTKVARHHPIYKSLAHCPCCA